uniref:Ion transport domain-containing protein n=1 Tax=Zooxanthella nutricula TaxID=1333877 RepID=A0A7S2J7U9_9DINO
MDAAAGAFGLRSTWRPLEDQWDAGTASDSEPVEAAFCGLEPSRIATCRQKAVMITTSRRFGPLVVAAAILNTVALIVEVDFPVGPTCAADMGADCVDAWALLNIAFTVFFCGELALRFLADASFDHFFCSGWLANWNILDTVVSCTNLLEIVCICLRHLSIVHKHGGFTEYVIRIGCLFRAMRLLRIFRYFRKLRLIAFGLHDAMVYAGWIILFALIVLVLFAIMCTQSIGHHPELFGNDAQTLMIYFGTVERSMFTLFQFLTLDDWNSVITIVEKYMPSMFIVLIVYVVFMGFILVSLFTGSMVNHMTRMKVVNSETVHMTDGDAIKEHFNAMFPRGCTMDMFVEMFGDGVLKRELDISDLDFTPEEAALFFQIFDHDDDTRVTADEFFKSCAIYRKHRSGMSVLSVLRLKARFHKLNAQVASDTLHPEALRNAVLRPSAATEQRMVDAAMWLSRLESDLKICESQVAQMHGLLSRRAYGAGGGSESDSDF